VVLTQYQDGQRNREADGRNAMAVSCSATLCYANAR